MFDYFKSYSSSNDQVCCKDCPTKCLYICQSDDLDLHSRSPEHLKLLLLFNLQYLGQYLSCSIQTWHDIRLMDVLYAHSHFDDLDARSQWVGKGKKSELHAPQLRKQ